MTLYRLDDKMPRIDPTAWIAENAIVCGNVEIGARASIWWNCVIRADNDLIRIGEECNVQDGSILHTDPGLVLELAPRVSIGHRVVLHGCTIGESCLIGMGAVLMNHVRLGRECLVGANTLIPEGKEFPDGVMILGTPGKVTRELSAEERARLRDTAARYVRNSRRHAAGLHRL